MNKQDDKLKRGRPPTREREEVMATVWCMVEGEMHKQARAGNRVSASEACRSLMRESAEFDADEARSIKVYPNDYLRQRQRALANGEAPPDVPKGTTSISNAEQLRGWYKRAKLTLPTLDPDSFFAQRAEAFRQALSERTAISLRPNSKIGGR